MKHRLIRKFLIVVGVKTVVGNNSNKTVAIHYRHTKFKAMPLSSRCISQEFYCLILLNVTYKNVEFNH